MYDFLRGFRLFCLCWSDGASLAPLDFALLSSPNEKNRYQGVTERLDSRVCGAGRRMEAVRKAMDSWFGMPAIISKAREHLHVICMVKRTPKILHDYEGKQRTVEDIYRRLRKRRGLAKIKTSAVVTMNDGQPARLVFVKNRGRGDWLALLCTDTSLPETEVVRVYGKRWDIEVFFRTIKQHLGLENMRHRQARKQTHARRQSADIDC